MNDIPQVLARPRDMIRADEALPDRAHEIRLPACHHVLNSPMALLNNPQLPEVAGSEHFCKIVFAMGCFWGAERYFYRLPGVVCTGVGYAGGFTKYPTYDDVCTGRTGHTEVAVVVFDQTIVMVENLLRGFWENHDPTQGMRQGYDVGSQYRSAIYCCDAALMPTLAQSYEHYQQRLFAADKGPITTELAADVEIYYAEAYHQQYLAKNPNGYCGLGGCGIRY